MKQAERQEYDDSGECGRRHRPDQLMNSFPYCFVSNGIEPQMSNDVLRDHDRVVDYQSNRDRHRSEGHEIERLPDQVHRENTDRERERDRRSADGSDARVVQKEQQDDDGQNRSDDHRVSHRLHRVADKRTLIVDRLQPHTRRQRFPDRRSEARHAVHDGKSVSAGLPGNVEQGCGFSVAGNNANVVFGPQSDCGHIANSQTMGDDNSGDVFGSPCFLRGHDQVLFVVLRQPPNRAYSGGLSDRVGKIVVRESLGGQASWIGDDLDLADVTSLHIYPSHSRHAGDERLELVARDVIQRRRIAPFEIVR